MRSRKEACDPEGPLRVTIRRPEVTANARRVEFTGFVAVRWPAPRRERYRRDPEAVPCPGRRARDDAPRVFSRHGAPSFAQTKIANLGLDHGVRPFRWTASCCGFDQALGVLILEVDGAAVAES